MPRNHTGKNTPQQNFTAKKIPLVKIFWTFFRIGLFTFGGGLAMGAVIRHELVAKNKWISDDDFMSEFSTATIVPGSIAVNIAYLQGNRLRGKWGAATAIIGTILPSFWIILTIVYFGLPYFNHPRVAAFFRGSALAIVGQLAFTGSMFSKKLLNNWRNIIICIISLLIVLVVGLHPIWSLIVAGILGYFLPFKNIHNFIHNDN